jgi:hypothetical protein
VIEAAKKRAGWSGECISTGQRLLRTTLLALYFLCILGSLCISLKGWVNVYDEGLAVLNGVRVLRGEIPYRDFWTVYPPGQSYALAAVYNLLGVSLLAARAYDTLVRFALVIGVYLVGRRIATPAAALVAGAFSALWLGTVGFYSYGVFPALAFALLATWSLIAFAGSEQAGWLVLAGALTGLTALWRVDIALYLGIALTLSLLLLALPSFASRGPDRPLAPTLRRVGILIAAAAVSSVPVYVYLALVGGPEPIWQQLVVFPSVVLGSVRRLPYPQVVPDVALFLAEPREYVRWARFVFPPLVYGAALAYLGWSLVRTRQIDRDARIRMVGGTAVTLFGLLVFAQALSRYDWIHVLPSTIWASLAAGLLVSRVPVGSWKHWPVAVSLSALLGATLFTYAAPSVRDLEMILEYASPKGCHSSLERASCAVVQPDQERAVAFVHARTGGDEPIFVGNARHDQILINDVMFYFLAARPCPTRYHELHPGVATTLAVQKEIVEEIRAGQVAWVVTVEWPPSTEPNGSAISSGIQVLDEFIRADYRPAAEFGRYVVWRRR